MDKLVTFDEIWRIMLVSIPVGTALVGGFIMGYLPHRHVILELKKYIKELLDALRVLYG